MAEWKTIDRDIESAEKMLLPQGSRFPEDARDVIRCWHSTDVAACPGSGKTTVLLAKLKILADRMPFEDGAGICVLSHTNVAVNEIKDRLSDYANKLLSYPNFIGTIQSFVDRFVTLPYLRNIAGRNVQAVDDITFSQHMLNQIQNNPKYSVLKFIVNQTYKPGGKFPELLDYVNALHLREEDGALCVGEQKKAGPDKKSTGQYRTLINDLLVNEGIMRYRDAYKYANEAMDNLSESYTELFSLRFQYVFIDEYQDCDKVQRRAIDTIFDETKCAVIRIGDSDQAIYNASEDKVVDWVPKKGFLPIMTSCRYSQEIADVISKLKKDSKNIVTFKGMTGIKPVLLVFDPKRIDMVIREFINVLEDHEIYDNKGIYKAIGAVGRSSGLKIGSYWPEFDNSAKKKVEYNYWSLVDDIVTSLCKGEMYKTENIIRKLICRVLHYAKVKNPLSKKEFSTTAMKKFLEENCRDVYRQWLLDLSRLQNVERENIDDIIRKKINEIWRNIENQKTGDVFEHLPEHFMREETVVEQSQDSERNVFIDAVRGRRIVFDTIHSVKGETHDVTLYLETENKRATDLNRILPYYGVGKLGASKLYDYSRKLVYVGMSRPRKLLCVAMQAKTYEKSKGVFDDEWEIIDLRE